MHSRSHPAGELTSPTDTELLLVHSGLPVARQSAGSARRVLAPPHNSLASKPNSLAVLGNWLVLSGLPAVPLSVDSAGTTPALPHNFLASGLLFPTGAA